MPPVSVSIFSLISVFLGVSKKNLVKYELDYASMSLKICSYPSSLGSSPNPSCAQKEPTSGIKSHL
jgi:hypothetical protein